MKAEKKNSNLLTHPAIFELMTDEERQTLLNTQYEVDYKPNEIIIKRGTKTTQLMYLKSGLAKSYLDGLSENNIIIRLIKPFEIIGVIAAYNNNHHLFSVMTIEDSTCCFFDLATYKKIAIKNPVVFDKLTENICLRSMDYFSKFVSLTQKQVNGRIAEAILYLCNNIYTRNPFKLTISKYDIAEMTSMSKDTAIRVLRSFHEEKIISIENELITILDQEKLKQISKKC